MEGLCVQRSIKVKKGPQKLYYDFRTIEEATNTGKWRIKTNNVQLLARLYEQFYSS